MAVRRQRRPPGAVRIIGGHWRGRRIPVPDRAGLRPTPDRVRETLFNWLQPVIRGARCVDLFAGSGALGLEALSRGALAVVAIERDPQAAERLRTTAASWPEPRLVVLCRDALALVESLQPPFDIAFVDPPFGLGLARPVLARLAARPAADGPAWIYLECERALEPAALPPGWLLHRAGHAGEVAYQLYRREAGAA
ncbi:MAG TPA: 16S rRNA (guanine(966)-N(2))-methyltransferase RsmD [Gammaproteobacteria bacterium]